jgi:DNA-binding CsgD family transcriptional regulator
MVAEDRREQPADDPHRQQVPIQVVCDRLRTQWVHQTRSFVRSLQLYRGVVERRARRSTGVDRPSAGRAGLYPTSTRVGQIPMTDASPSPWPGSTPAAHRPPLTGRQLEIARLIAQGMSNEQIAQALVLTPGTVGNHVGHILRRLGARNRAQVAAWITEVHADKSDRRHPINSPNRGRR